LTRGHHNASQGQTGPGSSRRPINRGDYRQRAGDNRCQQGFIFVAQHRLDIGWIKVDIAQILTRAKAAPCPGRRGLPRLGHGACQGRSQAAGQVGAQDIHDAGAVACEDRDTIGRVAEYSRGRRLGYAMPFGLRYFRGMARK